MIQALVACFDVEVDLYQSVCLLSLEYIGISVIYIHDKSETNFVCLSLSFANRLLKPA